MKKYVFKFWTETSDKQRKTLALRVIVSTWEDDDIPNGYLFVRQGTFNVFIDNYKIIKEKTSPDWKEYFKIHVSGGLRLQVYSDKYPVYLHLPELEED